MSIDFSTLILTKKDFWERQPTDNPSSLNGFRGTFAITDHNLIAEDLKSLIQARWPTASRFNKIPLADINEFLNSVWEGPGSMMKVIDLTHELQQAYRDSIRKDDDEGADTKLFKGYEPPTLDSDLEIEDDEVEEKAE